MLAYLPSLRVGFLTDDFDLVKMVADAYPQQLASFFASPINVFYRPLYGLSLALDYGLWGLHPSGYHLTNVLLHAANSLLLHRLAEAIGIPRTAGHVAALWFAVNPTVIGAVGWVAARADLLAAFFVLSGALLLLRYDHTGRTDLFTGSFILGLAALLSKETGVVFVGWSILLAVKSSSGRLKSVLPAVGGLTAYLAMRFLAVGWLESYVSWDDVTPLSILGELFTFLACLGFPLSDAFLGSAVLDWLAASALLLALLEGALRLRTKTFGIALGLFAISLVPALVVSGGPHSLYNSRHYYLPSAGAALVFGTLAMRIAQQMPKVTRVIVSVLSIAFLVGCLQLNILQWTRNSDLAEQIINVVASRASTLAPGTTLYVTGYRDLDGLYFPFHGNTIQNAVHLRHPEVSRTRVQCLGQNTFCAALPAPTGSTVLVVSVKRWHVTGASLMTQSDTR